MSRINPRGIQDLGNIIRKKSLQFHNEVALKIHTTRQRCRSLETRGPKVIFDASAEDGSSQLRRKQDLITTKFAKALYLQTHRPFINILGQDADNYESKELYDFNTVEVPLENELPLTRDLRDINYAEENKKQNESAMAKFLDRDVTSSSTKSKISSRENEKLLNKISDTNAKQIRSLSTYRPGNSFNRFDEFAKSTTSSSSGIGTVGNNQQSQYKYPQTQFSPYYRKPAGSRSGRQKSNRAAEFSTDRNAPLSSQSPIEMTKKNKKLSTFLPTFGEKETPRLFSINATLFKTPPTERRFVFRRNSSHWARSVTLLNPFSNLSTLIVPHVREKCTEDKSSPTCRNFPRFYRIPKDKKKKVASFKEICTAGPPEKEESFREICTAPPRKAPKKESGSKEICTKGDPKKPSTESRDPCKVEKACPRNNDPMPCADKRKKPQKKCEKPTRQDCETE